eukprot:Lankesteria_metandrocarpae@DN1954_c0_g1_i1.p1
MPKVVSYRHQIFTNSNRNLTDEKFRVFHCKSCEAHVVITDVPLNGLPSRRADNAAVLDRTRGLVKMTAVEDLSSASPVIVKRPQGMEKQYMYNCSECKRPVAYQSAPFDTAAEDIRFIYLIRGAVQWPKYRKHTPFACRVCGYVCQSQAQLDSHSKIRSHTQPVPASVGNPHLNNTVGSRSHYHHDGTRRHQHHTNIHTGVGTGGENTDEPLPPVIVG